MRWFNSNSHREDAKNAKKAVGELVDFLFPSRSWRLGGERLNLLEYSPRRRQERQESGRHR
jgi:hypothetical protein